MIHTFKIPNDEASVQDTIKAYRIEKGLKEISRQMSNPFWDEEGCSIFVTSKFLKLQEYEIPEEQDLACHTEVNAILKNRMTYFYSFKIDPTKDIDERIKEYCEKYHVEELERSVNTPFHDDIDGHCVWVISQLRPLIYEE